MTSSLVLIVGLLAMAPMRAQTPEGTQAIVDRAIQAHGGEARLTALKAGLSKSRGILRGQTDLSFTKQVYYQLPDHFKDVQEFEAGGKKSTATTVYDGEHGWLSTDGRTAEITDKATLSELRESAHLFEVGRLVVLKSPLYVLTALGESQVEGRPAVGIKVHRRSYRDIQLYFDRDSGLLVKIIRHARDLKNNRDIFEERVASDFQKFGGLTVGRRLAVYQDGRKVMDMEATEIRVLDRLDAREFARP